MTGWGVTLEIGTVPEEEASETRPDFSLQISDTIYPDVILTSEGKLYLSVHYQYYIGFHDILKPAQQYLIGNLL